VNKEINIHDTTIENEITTKTVIYNQIIGNITTLLVKQSSPVTGLEWPRGFQEVKVPRFRDNGTGWW